MISRSSLALLGVIVALLAALGVLVSVPGTENEILTFTETVTETSALTTTLSAETLNQTIRETTMITETAIHTVASTVTATVTQTLLVTDTFPPPRTITETLTVTITQSPPSPPAIAVVINELELNPEGTDAGFEWVELYNIADVTVDLGGWMISTTNGRICTYTLQGGTSIGPKDYLVVTFPTQCLDNADESVVLRGATGAEVDRTPTISDEGNDDRTWQRVTDGRDTDSAADWTFKNATKGDNN